MANYNVQEIVRAVVTNLNDLPGPSRQDVEGKERGIASMFLNSTRSTIINFQCFKPFLQHNFRVNANYGNVKNRTKSNRKGKEPIRSSNTGRFVSETKNISKKKIPRMPEPVFKDVCLLPSPEWSEVPRRKAKLVSQGMYIDAWSFDKKSDEMQLCYDIYKLFEEQLCVSGAEIK